MKVQFTAEGKRVVTVSEIPVVKKIIEYEDEDDYSAKDWAKVAARIVFDDAGAKIFEAKAQIAKNPRVRDIFDEGTGDIDVWIEFTAFSEYRHSFITAGVYLSDLWRLTRDNAEEIKTHMFIQKFKELD